MSEATPSPQLGQSGWTPETILAHVTSSIAAINQRVDALAQSDPSRNVLDLVNGEVRRLDDLRVADSRRIQELAELRTKYEEQLRDAEAKRIDAIRAVDVNAVAVASQRAADQATVLANQVVQSAEALRTLVASTAATVATSQQQLATTLSARLTTLEQGSYQAQGKSTFADPQLEMLTKQVAALAAMQQTGSGKSAGQSAVIAYIIAGFGMLIGAVSLLLRFTGTP